MNSLVTLYMHQKVLSIKSVIELNYHVLFHHLLLISIIAVTSMFNKNSFMSLECTSHEDVSTESIIQQQ